MKYKNTTLTLALFAAGFSSAAIADPIAAEQDKYLGNIWSAPQKSNFSDYWNQVVPENAGKWGSVERTRDVMNWTVLDEAYQHAKDHQIPFRMHVLVWGNQQPSWIESLSSSEQLVEIEEWYAAVAERYPEIDYLEVVNEPLHDAPRGETNGNYIDALGGDGETGWDWIITSFEMARNYFPNAKLLINDYNIIGSSQNTQSYLEIVELLQARELIDGIGLQAHAFSTKYSSAATLSANLTTLGNTGLPVYITEMDVDDYAESSPNTHSEQIQLQEYQRIFPTIWQHEAVAGVTLWGFREGMWREHAYLLDNQNNPRAALSWLKRFVQNRLPSIDNDQSFTVDENVANATEVGTLTFTDPDMSMEEFEILDSDIPFVISANGIISTNDDIDYEQQTSYQFEVIAHDAETQSYPVAVTVNVNDLDDNTTSEPPANDDNDQQQNNSSSGGAIFYLLPMLLIKMMFLRLRRRGKRS